MVHKEGAPLKVWQHQVDVLCDAGDGSGLERRPKEEGPHLQTAHYCKHHCWFTCMYNP